VADIITFVTGLAMCLFVLVTAYPAHKKWATDEPTWILVLSELALFFSGLTTLMVAFK
jgi:hypothetical protein